MVKFAKFCILHLKAIFFLVVENHTDIFYDWDEVILNHHILVMEVFSLENLESFMLKWGFFFFVNSKVMFP